MSGNQKRELYKIIISAVLYFVVILICKLFPSGEEKYKSAELFLYLIPYSVISWDIYRKTMKKLSFRDVFDEDFLIIVATLCAIFTGDYSEAVVVVLLYTIGELLQKTAVNRSRNAVRDLMDINPEYANIVKDGEIVKTQPESIAVDEQIVIKPGERIPLDCIVTEGSSMVDTSPITGEHLPRQVREGSELISGCINGEGMLYARVTRVFESSTVSKILELVESASDKKAVTEKFITKFARFYTPLVLASAALLALIPPLIYGDFIKWLKRACTFLVVSCPCALVISVPMSFFCGIGAASRKGILIKGSNFLETTSKVKSVVLDKTGTITKGEFKVSGIFPHGIDESKLLELAALAEAYSNHPIADSIRNSYGASVDIKRVSVVNEIPGKGLEAVVDGEKIFAGNSAILPEKLKQYSDAAGDTVGTIVYVSGESEFFGYIVISDTVKEDSAKAIDELKALGIRKIIMMTGDKKEAGDAVANQLKLDAAYCEMLPQDKILKLEELIEKNTTSGGKLAFAGDGVNDAPSLVRADLGIAMGSMGSDAAIEAADVVIMDDNILKIPLIIKIARKTMSIVKQNIVFALSVKFLVLLLGALGAAGMWAAVFADVGVSLIAVLNSARALKIAEN